VYISNKNYFLPDLFSFNLNGPHMERKTRLEKQYDKENAEVIFYHYEYLIVTSKIIPAKHYLRTI